MSKSLLGLLCILPLCSCWAPSTFWRVVCASGTQNSTKWSTSVTFFSDTSCQNAVRHVEETIPSTSVECTKWGWWSLKDGVYLGTKFQFSLGKACVRYYGALTILEDAKWAHPAAISMTSDRGSQYPESAWLGVQLSKPSEVRCVKFLQHEESSCPVVALQSSDNGRSWWNEGGWVETVTEVDGVVSGFIVQQLNRDAPPYRRPSGHAYGHPYKLPASESESDKLPEASISGVGWKCFYTLLVAIVMCFLLQCSLCIIVLLSLEVWYEFEIEDDAILIVQGTKVTNVRFYPMTMATNAAASTPSSSDRLARIKLVCHPRWLLAGSSLADFISHSTSELDVLPHEAAQRAFPHGPLRDFEAVIRVPRTMSMEEVGRILQALVEKRRAVAGEEPLSARLRLPRFQVIASVGRSFLHFGGSVGCANRRWRSCPARIFSERHLSLSVAL